MTKYEFNDLRSKCPWFFREKGEPKCIAQDSKLSITRHCSKKNCAISYWKEKLNEPYRN